MQISTMLLESESLKGNAPGDPTKREVTIIEHNVKTNTPIIIGLAGFFGTNISFMNRSFTSMDFPSVLKRIVETNLVDSFIIALPDTMTSFGGNQFINSNAVGNYEDFICRDLLGALHHKYGIRKNGIFGKSSGGFGSYTLSARHPELFSGFIDVSGDSAFEYCYIKDFPGALKTLQQLPVEGLLKKFKNMESMTSQELNAMNIVAMAAFYSPLLDQPGSFELPFDIDTGVFKEDVWKRWKLLDPLYNVKHYAESLKKQKIILQVGTKDEFALDSGIKSLSLMMNKLGVENKLLTYDLGHFSIERLYMDSLPELINALS